MRKYSICAGLGIITGLFFCRLLWAQDYIQVPVAMHMASTVSDGVMSIGEIVSVARQNNFRCVIITDRDLARWEYGLWPARGIIKKVVQDPCIFRYGIQRYIDDIQAARRAHPDMVILAGTESSPFYYWEGNPFQALTMLSASEHMLVVGLEKPDDYRRLPVIGNPAGAGRRYDPYHGDAAPGVYQQFIDYARGRGALVFWAHPEATYNERDGLLTIRTDDYSLDLLRTDRYTGFEIYYDGDQKVGTTAGIWDEILADYCAGRRSQPVWAIAGSGYDKNGTLDSALAGVRTVLLVNKLDAQEILAALASGRSYAVKGSGSGNFVLDKFLLRDPEGATVRTMGEEFVDSRPPLVEISGHFLDGQQTPVTIQLIRNGRLYQEFQEKTPFHIVFEETQHAAARSARSYYRVQIFSSQVSLATNPIFSTQSAR